MKRALLAFVVILIIPAAFDLLFDNFKGMINSMYITKQIVSALFITFFVSFIFLKKEKVKGKNGKEKYNF